MFKKKKKEKKKKNGIRMIYFCNINFKIGDMILIIWATGGFFFKKKKKKKKKKKNWNRAEFIWLELIDIRRYEWGKEKVIANYIIRGEGEERRIVDNGVGRN